MRDVIENFFDKNKIEYFSVLDYRDVRETRSDIIKREDFVPKSVIIYLIPYFVGYGENLSAYATSLDYHIILRDISDKLIASLKEKDASVHAKGYGDHSPIDERHAALISGLGILGDSGLLINESYGTFTFIGDVVSDIAPEELGAKEPLHIERCVGCGKCKSACPTGILRGVGCDCLSAITQKKGELSEGEISMMRKYNTVWGCDVCQSVCPYNSDPKITPLDFFREERITRLDRDFLSGLDKESFVKRAFAWRGRKTVERNLELLNY